MRRGRFRNPFVFGALWQRCKEHIFLFKTFYIIIIICGVGAFALGIAGASVYAHRVTIIEISDGYILGMINGTLNGGSLFWSRMLSMIGMFALVLLFGLHRYMTPLHFLVIIYRAFLTGFKAMLLISIYGITGVFSALVFVVPFETVFFISISFVITCNIDRCLIYGRSGVPFRGRDGFTGLLHRIWPAAAAIVIFSIIEAILIPVFIGIF